MLGDAVEQEPMQMQNQYRQDVAPIVMDEGDMDTFADFGGEVPIYDIGEEDQKEQDLDSSYYQEGLAMMDEFLEQEGAGMYYDQDTFNEGGLYSEDQYHENQYEYQYEGPEGLGGLDGQEDIMMPAYHKEEDTLLVDEGVVYTQEEFDRMVEESDSNKNMDSLYVEGENQYYNTEEEQEQSYYGYDNTMGVDEEEYDSMLDGEEWEMYSEMGRLEEEEVALEASMMEELNGVTAEEEEENM